MDTEAILRQLREKREHIEEIILAFERMQIGTVKSRGHPPKWLAAAKQTQSESVELPLRRRGRPPNRAINLR
jgi:hypothetical protein